MKRSLTAVDQAQDVAFRETGLGTDASSDSPSSDVSSETVWIDVDAAMCFVVTSKYAGPCSTGADCIASFERDSGVFVPVTPSGPREIFSDRQVHGCTRRRTIPRATRSSYKTSSG
jgi:hypothetical protein